ncbi:MAG: 30S ribosomal protein S20 [Mycoplasma sp.]|nr:30S ribosomal protein S20 [Mycoplasma sp.]
MANIKANIKSIRKTIKRQKRNHSIKTIYKNNIKRARNSKNFTDLNKSYKSIDSALAKGVITKNKANRLKSRTAKAINKSIKSKV